jgi:hypothetical protein
MLELHPDIIIDAHTQKKSVVLPYLEWQKILAIMYEKAKAEDDEFISFEQAVNEINAGIDN